MKRQFYKIAFACMIFLCGINFGAQAQVDSLRTTLDNIFLHVDKSQVPTGFLDEYGAQFANLKTYNGILTDSNIVNAMAWHNRFYKIQGLH